MFDFVMEKAEFHQEIFRKIEALEKKYSITFPNILKEYYGSFDGAKIRRATFCVNGYTCEVAKIVPIMSDQMSFEKITDGDKSDGFLAPDLYPIARDRGGNYYYWDSKSYHVYLVLSDDYENPFLIADSVEDFFQKLNDKE